jgi:hypothetical protein
MADRSGRLEYRPKRLRAEILPYDDRPPFESLLKELLDKRDPDGNPAFLILYEVNGFKYLQILHFSEHQYPHKNERPSTIPAPCLNGASMVQEPELHDTKTPESIILNPESPIPKSRRPDSGEAPPPSEEEFDLFWRAYPKHEGKMDARKAWNKIKPKKELVQRILQDIARRKQSDQWLKDNGQYIPWPQKYLNHRLFEDGMGTVQDTKQVGAGAPKSSKCSKCGAKNVMLDEETGLCQLCYKAIPPPKETLQALGKIGLTIPDPQEEQERREKLLKQRDQILKGKTNEMGGTHNAGSKAANDTA